MSKTKKALSILCVILLCCLIAAGIAFSALKIRSMYLSLCKKIDYTNETVYAISEAEKKTHQILVRESSRYSFDYSWVGQTPPLVAHALGGINGDAYTNSLEAFEHNYALGHRVFEVDFDITEDHHLLIASHGKSQWHSHTQAQGEPDKPYTYDQFMSTPLLSKYTPLDCRGVIELMSRYPDVYLITDTKHTDLTTVLLQFSQLVTYAREIDPSVLDRIIPQIYHEDMLNWVMSVYPFKSVVYTLYKAGNDPEAVYSFCEFSGVRFVTLRSGWIPPECIKLWDKLGITVAAHTVNDGAEAQHLRDQGVDYLYTDFLTP